MASLAPFTSCQAQAANSGAERRAETTAVGGAAGDLAAGCVQAPIRASPPTAASFVQRMRMTSLAAEARPSPATERHMLRFQLADVAWLYGSESWDAWSEGSTSPPQ